jgi:hypothetical protein
MTSTDLLAARRKALEARPVESSGKRVPRLMLRPPTDPLAARVKAVQDRLAEAYQARQAHPSDHDEAGRAVGAPFIEPADDPDPASCPG